MWWWCALFAPVLWCFGALIGVSLFVCVLFVSFADDENTFPESLANKLFNARFGYRLWLLRNSMPIARRRSVALAVGVPMSFSRVACIPFARSTPSPPHRIAFANDATRPVHKHK